ncbi:MAG: hypothetical protein GYB31_05220 [Bacteroidetes bacterium]|nr:hypothetical protein [Bacteroidota bacterium]
MINSRLIQLLTPLSRREMSRLREFAESPYHNKHIGVINLISHLSAIYPDFSESSCDKKQLFPHIFPEETFDYQRISVVFSYAVKLVEQFFQVEAFAESNAASELFLLERLRKDQHSVLYKKHLNKIQKGLRQAKIKNSDYHLRASYIAREADFDYRQKGEHEWDPNLQKKQEELDYFFISEKLKDHCELRIRRKILKGTYTPYLLDEILTYVESRKAYFETIPAVNVYHQLYRLLTGHPDYQLESVLAALQKQHGNFSRSEQQDLYNMLLNYCIGHINRGDDSYHAKALKIIRWQLKKELIFQQGILPEWHYKNITAIALRAGETEWVYQFLQDYKGKLHPDSQTRAWRFNLASYYYAIGNPDQALEMLAGLEYNDPRYYLATKALLLRTYYDLGEYEALQALSNAFRQNMKRNKRMTSHRIQGLSNLFKFTKRAMLLRNRLDYQSASSLQKDLHKLQHQINDSQSLINKNWLLEKIHELDKNIRPLSKNNS